MSAYDPLPVLLAREGPGGTWLAWCPYCRTEHSHGSEPGHRSAHCLAGPLLDRGYIIAAPGSAYLLRLQRKRPVMASGDTVLLADGTQSARAS